MAYAVSDGQALGSGASKGGAVPPDPLRVVYGPV
jgi:hypothetical protein